jgi:hypothetical protein
MPGNLLTTGSTVQCPHGGQALLLTSNTSVLGPDGPVLLETDVHVGTGCPFTVGTVYSPCLRIEWQAAATATGVNELGPLVETSVGICYSAQGAPQGTAIVAATQQEASSQ